MVLEPRVSSWRLVERRVRRLGLATVAGQVLFSVVAVPLLTRAGQRRIAAIAEDHGLDLSPIDRPVQRIPSVNSDEARDVLRRLAPDVVVVSGTRIISQETLDCVEATFVNLHCGVTPQYRGVHGGYWALVEGRPDLMGSTVHVVDRGIDTGRILAQVTAPVTPEDSFVTYPYLQLAVGVPELISAVGTMLAGAEPGRAAPVSEDAPSRLRTHPTLWGYLGARIRRSVA